MAKLKKKSQPTSVVHTQNPNINVGDKYMAKDRAEIIVDLITNEKIITTLRGGTLKQPERLMFNKSQFETGMGKFWIKTGEKFVVPLTHIISKLFMANDYAYITSDIRKHIQKDDEDDSVITTEISINDINTGDIMDMGSDEYRLIIAKGTDIFGETYISATDTYNKSKASTFLLPHYNDYKSHYSIRTKNVWKTRVDRFICKQTIKKLLGFDAVYELYDDLDTLDTMSEQEKIDFLKKQYNYFKENNVDGRNDIF